ncbi:manganese transporter [Saprolegnia diclina VS20]|uniref:Manganese transporter n=1 Tax=Saprolegnia diclina (strain VS20) TaxID=1156394 RepID=T0Q6X5_SAPDV|nr:manganese transporter [Saprolegnia diclina VS20]EQC30351.1 manganese transporter [Saprolegnia diclina VS20]|eukprot:XP_008616204.1 manganese transporter [Saprolegnia diclina VS20]
MITTPKASAYHAHETSEASAVAIQIEAKEGSITHASPETSAVGRFFRRLLPALSSAFVASVAYVDPGNFATNIQSGSNYGFTLLWVILVANVMAMLFQTLSAKLGLATGKNLPEIIREQCPTWFVLLMWLIAEIAAIATDVAEFIGSAIAFELLFGISLVWGALITCFTTMLLLLVHQHQTRVFEAVIFSLVSVIVVSYIVETALQSIDWGDVAYHTFVPAFDGKDSVLLAVGIVGATVMPHVIYLHSSLTQGRFSVSETGDVILPPLAFEITGIIIALGIAGFVNMSMLIMAAATFHANGQNDITTIETAYVTLEPLLGKAASTVFAIGLLASGISSSAVGTLAGQVIMAGFLRRQVSMWIRRLVTIVPSLIIVFAGVDPTEALVVSQVVLSFCIPFALVPLAYFTSKTAIMGAWANSYLISAITAVLCLLIVGLNVFLIVGAFTAES